MIRPTLAQQVRAAADANASPDVLAGMAALIVGVTCHDQTRYLPSEPAQWADMLGRLCADPFGWCVVARNDCPYVFIRAPIYVGDSRALVAMKAIDLRQMHAIEAPGILDQGLKVDGATVPADVKPQIREAYWAFTRKVGGNERG